MRIISGKYKGRVIKMPTGIRPTQNKVRKALFDILADVKGFEVLELFAGSGAIGLEALSWGAKRVVFVENNRNTLKFLKSNLSFLPQDSYEIIPLDVGKALKLLLRRGEKFDFVFLDPPYQGSLSKKTLQRLSACDILTRYGYVVIQHFGKVVLPEAARRITCWRNARYGDTILTFYRKSDKGATPKQSGLSIY